MINKIILISFGIIFLVAWIGFPAIIKCPYKISTGKPCLFCGTLTSFSLVLHGRVGEALKVNPIGILTFIIIIFILGRCFFRLDRIDRIKK